MCVRKLRAVLKRAIYVQCHYYCRKVLEVSKRVCKRMTCWAGFDRWCGHRSRVGLDLSGESDIELGQKKNGAGVTSDP